MVGKTSIILRFVGNKFMKDLHLTIAVDIHYKLYKKIGFSLWDLGGQSGFDFIRPNMLVGSKIIILVFDISQPDSGINRITYYKNLINNVQTAENTFFVVFYNKADLVKEINFQENIKNIQKMIFNVFGEKFNFFIISAKTGKNILEAFDYLSERVNEELI